MNLNRVELEPYCLELVDKYLLFSIVVFSTLKCFIYIVCFLITLVICLGVCIYLSVLVGYRYVISAGAVQLLG